MNQTDEKVIALEHEEKISLNQARKLPCLKVDGEGPSLASMHRWCERGVRGNGTRVVLESMMIGGKRVTSEAAIMRFLRRRNIVHVPIAGTSQTAAPGRPPRTGKQRDADQSRAHQVLKQAGIG